MENTVFRIECMLENVPSPVSKKVRKNSVIFIQGINIQKYLPEIKILLTKKAVTWRLPRPVYAGYKWRGLPRPYALPRVL